MTSKEFAELFGIQTSATPFKGKKDGEKFEYRGYIVWRVRREGLTWYEYHATPKKGGSKHSPRRRSKPVSPTDVCQICSADLPRRRRVTVNNVTHCITCNRLAFVDHDYMTRKALGI